MICVDNSEHMRNGDFVPNRLQSEQEAVNLICQCKLKLHPENNVGLLSMADRVEVLVTLTNDTNRLFMKLHQVRPNGSCRFLAGVKVAHLALKHRQGRNHKTRIVFFVGSPVLDDPAELVKLAKKLKKEKVNVDVINFGEEQENTEKLKAFIETLNGKDGTGSRMVSVPSGSNMSEALVSSPILRGEDGAAPPVIPGGSGGYDFGEDDPELAMALRISMEEQRARQEDDARRVIQQTGSEVGATALSTAISSPTEPNLDAMTEDEQIAYALQMSLAAPTEEPMDVETTNAPPSAITSTAASGTASSNEAAGVTTSGANAASSSSAEVEDALMADPRDLAELVSNLPGMDLQNKQVQDALKNMKKDSDKSK